MRKRILSFALCLLMVLSLLPPGIAQAAGTANHYGTATTYKPQNRLYVEVNGTLQPLLLDGRYNEYYNKYVDDLNPHAARRKMEELDLSLNRFLTINFDKTSQEYLACFVALRRTPAGKLEVYYPGMGMTFNGRIDIPSQDVRNYWVHYDSAPGLSKPSGSNMDNMLLKGDVEYQMCWKTATVKKLWSKDTCSVNIFNETHHFSGNGTTDHYISDGKPNVWSSYKPAGSLNGLHFDARSNLKDENDAYMYDGVLYGQDIKGPEIRSITVTSDAAGQHPLTGAISLDDIAKLQNRTIYFQVEWDEPVRFDDTMTAADVAKVPLTIQTRGVDGGSAMLATAYFHSFAPSKTDATPTMTFEYRILDPYVQKPSSLAVDRGYKYDFTGVELSSSENQTIMSHLKDLAGNGPGTHGYSSKDKLYYEISGNPYVDLIPLTIERVSADKQNRWNEFVKPGEQLSFELRLNKTLNTDIFRDEYGDVSVENNPEAFPVVTLNLLDKNGQQIVLKAGTGVRYCRKTLKDGVWVPVLDENGGKIYDYPSYPADMWGNQYLTYSLSMYPDAENQYRLPPGEKSVRIVKIESNGKMVDNAGYRLPDYHLNDKGVLVPVAEHLPGPTQHLAGEYNVSPDRQYRLDFDKPVVTTTLELVDEVNHIARIHAAIRDENLAGCTANYRIFFDGEYEGQLLYQTSANANWTENWKEAGFQWIRDIQAPTISISSAINPGSDGMGHAYAFLKLPATAEVCNLRTEITVTDEGDNQTIDTAKIEGTLVDTIGPRLICAKNHSERISDTEIKAAAAVYFEETSAFRELSYAWAPKGAPKPDASAFRPASGIHPDPVEWSDDLRVLIDGPTPAGNAIETWTLWFRAEDIAGNVSEIQEDLVFDFRLSEIEVTFENNTAHLALQHPAENKYFWWTVVEKPANYIKDGVDYGDPVAYMEATGYDLLLMELVARNSNNRAGSRFSDREEGTPLAPGGGVTNRDFVIDMAYEAPSAPGEYTSPSPVGDMEAYKWNTWKEVDVLNEPHRPLLLVVGVNGCMDTDPADPQPEGSLQPDNKVGKNLLLKVFEVPAMGMEQPEVTARQVRFSTNDAKGNRTDYIRTGLEQDVGQGLLWADDPTSNTSILPKILNYPVLYDFAEAQFVLSGDPVMDLNGLDLQQTELQLVKVLRESDRWGTEDWHKNQGVSREVIQHWSLNTVELDRISDGSMKAYEQGATKIGTQEICPGGAPLYSFSVAMDPGMLETFVQPSQTGPDSFRPYVCTYEFRLKPVYTDGTAGTEQLLTHFIFENDPSSKLELVGFTHDAAESGGTMGLDSRQLDPVPVVLDASGKDVTPNVPLWNISMDDPYTGDLAPVFQAVIGDLDHSYKLLASTVPGAASGSDLRVRWGTQPDQLTHTVRIEEESKDGPTTPDSFVNLPAGGRMRLYYQAEDSIRGTSQPIHVLELYRDDTPPVLEIFVSEQEQPVPEVQVSVKSVTDGHWEGEGADRRFIVDTPSEEILTDEDIRYPYIFRAEREVLPEDDVPPEYQDYPLDVEPDAENIFHFISNGTLRINSSRVHDGVYNYARVLVNGEPVDDVDGHVTIVIDNVDTAAPKFVTEPTWTVDQATGSVTVEAQVDDAYAGAYLRFDDAYATQVTGQEPAADPALMDPAYRLVSLIAGPGVVPKEPVMQETPDGPMQEVIPGPIDPTGKLQAKFYVQPSQTAATVTLVLMDAAGHRTESPVHTLNLTGVQPQITNKPNAASGSLPAYEYGKELTTNVPVSIPQWNSPLGLSHRDLPIYADGKVRVTAEDLFGDNYELEFYGDIFTAAFAHSLTFRTADGQVIDPMDKTNQNVTVTVDTAGTPGLTVNGKTTWSKEFTANGTLEYTLKVPNVGEKQFKLPVSCIDKTAPEPIISVQSSGPQDDPTKTYTVTFQVEGFKDNDGTLIAATENGAAPSSVTFSKSSPKKTYTFHFRDAVGNEGSATVSAADYTFVDATDTTLAAYRLTYSRSSLDSLKNLFTVTGTAEEAPALPAIVTNSDLSVTVEGYNYDGQQIPVTMTKGKTSAGTLVFPEMQNVVFTGEHTQERYAEVTLKSGSSTLPVRISLPGGSIDTTAPTGKISFVPEGESRKVYLVTEDQDLAENGVSVEGKQVDGKLLELQKDETGWFVQLDLIGRGRFLLRDKAGNTGSVSFAVTDIDKDPPKLQHEGWFGAMEATTENLDQLLQMPTNSSIFAFFRFNEQLSRVEATAYDRRDGTKLTPVEDYVTAIVSGNALTVEFKQNCQVQLVAYDLKNNAYTLWRPEDGPITVIDKVAPTLAQDPKPVYADNKATFTYVFAGGEEVALTSTPGTDPVYKNEHTVTFDRNGQYILTFADRAGNVLSVHPKVDRIDDLAPDLSIAMDVVDRGKSRGGLDAAGKPYYYTAGQVAIYLNITDASGLQAVTARRVSGKADAQGETLPVQEGSFRLSNVQAGSGTSDRTYSHKLLVDENGLYEIVATDQWGHTTTIRPSVTMIDKTAPSIGFTDNRPVYVPMNSSSEDLRSAVMQGVTCSDSQSGKGVAGKDKLPAVTMTADLSGVKLDTAGSYEAVIRAEDLLGNKGSKTRTVVVTADGFRSFDIDGQLYPMNEICSMPRLQTIDIKLAAVGETTEPITLYWSKGHLTAAQMKYAEPFDGRLALLEEGYYTILAQSAEREMYVVYVYAY